jgi:hypothetical protein
MSVNLATEEIEVEFEGSYRPISGRTSDRIKISLSKAASVELYLVLSTS